MYVDTQHTFISVLIMHHSNNNYKMFFYDALWLAFYELISFLVVAIYIYIKADTLLSMP